MTAKPPKAPFSRTPRGNTLIFLSASLITIGILFVQTAQDFIFAGLGLFMFYYASRLFLELKTSALNRVQFARAAPKRRNEGEGVGMKLPLVNRTLQRLNLEVVDGYPPLFRLRWGTNASMVEVPARGFVELEYGLAPTSVGLQKFGPVHLVLRDIAGLFFYERNIDVGTEVEITPRVKELARGSLAAVQVSTYGGSVVSTRKGEGLEFADVREYARGDPYKRIEWRSTARTGKLMVRDYYAETQLKVMVVLDTTSTMAYGEAGETKLDYAARSIAALVSYLGRRGDFVGLTTVNGVDLPKVIPLARGSGNVMTIMGELSRVSPGENTPGAISEGIRRAMVLGNIGGKTLFFLITDLNSEVDLGALRQLLAMRHEVVVISPFTPLFEAQGLAGMDRMIYSIRTTHQLRLRADLVRTAAKSGVTVVDVGPGDLFSKLISRVEELRRMGGS